MSNRGKLNYRKSQAIFTKHAVKSKALNSSIMVPRGGIRL